MRISDWSSDVCSSDLIDRLDRLFQHFDQGRHLVARRAEYRRSLLCGQRRPLSLRQPQRCGDDHEHHVLAGEPRRVQDRRSEEHTSELQSLMRISYAVFCLKKKKNTTQRKSTKGQTTYNENE